MGSPTSKKGGGGEGGAVTRNIAKRVARGDKKKPLENRKRKRKREEQEEMEEDERHSEVRRRVGKIAGLPFVPIR